MSHSGSDIPSTAGLMASPVRRAKRARATPPAKKPPKPAPVVVITPTRHAAEIAAILARAGLEIRWITPTTFTASGPDQELHRRRRKALAGG